MNLNNINFDDLMNKGFLVVPEFLDFQEQSTMIKIHVELIKQYNTTGGTNKNYAVLRGVVSASVYDKANSLLEIINQKTDLKTNTIMGKKVDYLDNSIVKFGWHQDHENYYRWQNSYNDLNFWIAVSKKVGTESGLDVIPHTAFAERAPDIHLNHILGKGAKFFMPDGDITVMDDTETGEKTQLPFNINDIKESPTTFSRDLLLMRGDLIHRSQEPQSHRVAVSFRASNRHQVVSKEKFYGGSEEKHRMIQNNILTYEAIMKKYETVDSFVIEEIL
jgi:hypothetical protein